jgi:transcription initiation factor IIE alpha subunit
MPSDEIPEPIQRFLFELIHSFEELEVVVLLNRNSAQRWTAQSIADQLKIAVNLVDDALEALRNRGIVAVVTEGGANFHVASEDYKPQLSELVTLYERHRLEIVMLMSTNAIERVRTGAMRTFADCFFVGKKRGDG